MCEDIDKYIPVTELVNRGVYRICGRNASVGVWDAERKGFVVARTKFCHTFLDVEYHWDTDPTYGTVKPLEYICEAPDCNGVPLIKYLKDMR